MTFARETALRNDLNAELFVGTLKCESQFVYNARGDDGQSRGIAQISDIWHAEVSDELADDPYFSILWMAERWKQGYAREWTCYRLLTK
jgi:hypothetical protein